MKSRKEIVLHTTKCNNCFIKFSRDQWTSLQRKTKRVKQLLHQKDKTVTEPREFG